MQAWLIELGTGVALCLGGIGLWALPTDTPVIGRPPVIVGWLVIALGVLIIILSIATRSGYEVQSPLKRKSPLIAKYEGSRPERIDSATGPSLHAVPQKVEKVYSEATPADLVAIRNMPNLTSVERGRLLAPHVGKWMRIEDVVLDVHAEPGIVHLSMGTNVIDPISADFRSDLDRAAALRKGARVRVLGKFSRFLGANAMLFTDCEFLS